MATNMDPYKSVKTVRLSSLPHNPPSGHLTESPKKSFKEGCRCRHPLPVCPHVLSANHFLPESHLTGPTLKSHKLLHWPNHIGICRMAINLDPYKSVKPVRLSYLPENWPSGNLT